MANSISMADLLAKQDAKIHSVSRGQEVTGTVVAIQDKEIIVDLGIKAEGVILKKELPTTQLTSLKTGDQLTAIVFQSESQSGQIILTLQKPVVKGRVGYERFDKFKDAKDNGQTVRGRALEVNKGGLIVEVDGIRGFLPSSQATLSSASNLEELIGKEVDLLVIEVDPGQNRLIFSQKTKVTEDVKQKLESVKVGQKVKGEVAAVLPFGIFVTLGDGVEGLVHISEISWEKVEDPATIYKVGDQVEAVVSAVDLSSGRVNLSVKQLSADPFVDKTKKFQPEDVVKGVITKITPNGLFVKIEEDIEGFVPSASMDQEAEYEVGKSMNFLVDSVDKQKRRVNLSPFITSTKDLIYK